MYIQHGWNAHFQDEVLTTMEDDGISILCWMFVSLIFNSVPRAFNWLLVIKCFRTFQTHALISLKV